MFKKLKKLFLKKKKMNSESFELSESDKKWNQMCELYAKGDWEDPNFYLFDYYSGVNGEGHYCYFDNNENEMKNLAIQLKQVLPEDLYDNFEKAYHVWLQGDGEKTEDACRNADSVFAQSENRIIEILKKFAETL